MKSLCKIAIPVTLQSMLQSSFSIVDQIMICLLYTSKLNLIRHGLTQGHLDGRYIGSGTDLPLCAEGRAQLEELKAKFQYPDVQMCIRDR